MEIKYLRHDQINKEKWDKCINTAVNGIVYAYAWYLDIVSFGWDALVMGDYEAVMPIPAKKKYGIHYLYQPRYTQQLGVFTRGVLDEELVNKFFYHIPKRFKVIDLNLSSYNKLAHPKFSIKPKVTYELDLIRSYRKIYADFNANTKRNIKRSRKHNLSVSKHISLKDFLSLLKETKGKELNLESLNILRRIIPFTIRYNLGTTYGAYDEKNNLVAVAYIVKSNNKAIYHLAASNERGKEMRAMFGIIDSFIFENAEKNLTLDFEGSMVDSIARFYRGFGATPVQYLNARRNRLPWPLSVLK